MRPVLPSHPEMAPWQNLSVLARRAYRPVRRSGGARPAFEPEFESTTVSRNTPAYVRWVQEGLNRSFGAGLRVDGVTGPRTRNAVRAFQGQHRLRVDGIVGPDTERALIAAGAGPPPLGQLSSAALSRAVAHNRDFATSLGWKAFTHALAGLVGFPASMVPNERQLAAGVASWQRRQGGLAVDGVIGPRTLERMQAALRQIPASTGVPSRVAAAGGQSESEPFVSGPGIGHLGHTLLTQDAAAAFPQITRPDLTALIAGVTRPDALELALRRDEQKRHILRRSLCQSQTEALREAQAHLIGLHSRALSAPPGAERFALIGEALHLIQDSFSNAHTERQGLGLLSGVPGPPFPIVFIRIFIPPALGFPIEHKFPADIRDLAVTPLGLTAHAQASIAASRQFLEMMLRHLANPLDPANGAELRQFIGIHLALSPSHVPTRRFYPIC